MTTYYVDTAVGNDANAGTSAGAGNAWATIDKAMNTVAAGDKVWVKATGTYDENGNIDTAGATQSPIVFEGYSSTTGDNGKVTWKNSSGNALTDTTSSDYYCFKNFSFDGSSSQAVAAASILNFINCDFINNGSSGAFVSTNVTFVNCTFGGNSLRGIQGTGNVKAVGCTFYTNTRQAMDVGIDSAAYRCVFYNNATGGSYNVVEGGDYFCLLGCTFDGDGSTPALFAADASQSLSLVVDNILYDATTAISVNDNAAWANTAFCGYNLINSCTNSYYNGSAEIPSVWFDWWGTGDVTSAPAFTDEASDDYTLDSASPAVNAGVQPGGIT
jgi:hypothetical protein